MDLINTLSGDGTGIAKGTKTQVAYELKIYQHWRPVFGKAREMLTLEMNDESTLRFSFADTKGNITAGGSIRSIG
jgi:hypothetical protein